MAADIKTGRGALSDYASVLLERRKNSQVLIVMPFYDNYAAIAKHLELLSAQTTSDFDIVIVASVVSDEKKLREIIDGGNYKFGVALVKRKEDTGSAGGYFTGEKYALENGYRAILIGDDDLPAGGADAHRKEHPGMEGGRASRSARIQVPDGWRGQLHVQGNPVLRFA